jgi:signal peptidase I
LLNGGYSQGTFAPNYRSGEGPEQFGRASEWGGQDGGMQQLGRDGLHWVGDLIFEVDLETTADSSEAILELVEAGIKYRCRIDLKSGKATLQIDDVDKHSFESSTGQPNLEPTAQTSIRAGSRSTLRFSNCDDELLLWVDGDLVTFDAPTTFNSLEMRSDADNHPQFLETHPLDAAPVAVAVRGGEATIRRLRVDRDQYYIATQDSDAAMSDYDMNELYKLNGGRGVTLKQIQQVLATPTLWSDFVGWSTRRRVSFELNDDQFFPMGDNSPESLDARCWAGWKSQIQLPRGVNEDAWIWSDKSYVPRDLLVGKALMVFWPHSWNAPVPFLPNVKRMKLIR